MTDEEVAQLDLGIYILYWKDGGSSIAAVGNLHNGQRWMAPVNWTNESATGIAQSGDVWENVVRAILVYSKANN